MKPESESFPGPTPYTTRLPQQREHVLLRLVGLRQHRDTGLLQDLRLAQIRRFLGEVGVLDPRAGAGDVVRHVLQVADGRVEAVLHRAQVTPQVVDEGQGVVDHADGLVGAVLGLDVDGADIAQRRCAGRQQSAARDRCREALAGFVDHPAAHRGEGSAAGNACRGAGDQRTVLVDALHAPSAGPARSARPLDLDIIAFGVFEDQRARVGRIDFGRDPSRTGFVVDGRRQPRQIGSAGRSAGAIGNGRGRGRVLPFQFERDRPGGRDLEIRLGDRPRRHAGLRGQAVDRRCDGAGGRARRRDARARGSHRAVDGQGARSRVAVPRAAAGHGNTGGGIDPLRADIGGFRAAHADLDGLVRVGAHLEFLGGEATVQQGLAVEGGGVGDPVQLLLQLADLFLQGGAVGAGVGVVRRLHRQLAHPLQDVGGFLQRAFRRLRQGNAVVGVTNTLVETLDLGGHAVGNRQTGGIVFGRVDAQAGGQALHRGVEVVLAANQTALGVQGRGVGIDSECHGCVLR